MDLTDKLTCNVIPSLDGQVRFGIISPYEGIYLGETTPLYCSMNFFKDFETEYRRRYGSMYHGFCLDDISLKMDEYDLYLTCVDSAGDLGDVPRIFQTLAKNRMDSLDSIEETFGRYSLNGLKYTSFKKTNMGVKVLDTCFGIIDELKNSSSDFSDRAS